MGLLGSPPLSSSSLDELDDEMAGQLERELESEPLFTAAVC
jgi:hypothetical protein